MSPFRCNSQICSYICKRHTPHTVYLARFSATDQQEWIEGDDPWAKDVDCYRPLHLLRPTTVHIPCTWKNKPEKLHRWLRLAVHDSFQQEKIDNACAVLEHALVPWSITDSLKQEYQSLYTLVLIKTHLPISNWWQQRPLCDLFLGQKAIQKSTVSRFFLYTVTQLFWLHLREKFKTNCKSENMYWLKHSKM